MQARPLAGGRATQTAADLCRVQVELGECPAQRVAMHTELLRGLALIASVMRKHLKNIATFELPESVCVGDTGAMHLRDQAVQFALQLCPHLAAQA